VAYLSAILSPSGAALLSASVKGRVAYLLWQRGHDFCSISAGMAQETSAKTERIMTRKEHARGETYHVNLPVSRCIEHRYWVLCWALTVWHLILWGVWCGGIPGRTIQRLRWPVAPAREWSAVGLATGTSSYADCT